MKTLELINLLISFAVLLQGVEILLIRKSWSDQGVWRWETLKKDYSGISEKILDFFLKEKRFLIVISVQVLLAAFNIFWPQFWITAVLFLTVVLTAIRWRSTFNGGSDYMTALVLLAVSIANYFPENQVVILVCFAYIGVQTVLSYFLAGIAKVKQKSWRSGEALTEFLLHSNYAINPRTKRLAKKPQMARMASKIILAFELTFPLVFLDSRICLFYLGIGFLFHLENFFDLGLNRFVFAWLAAYPSLYYLSDYIHL